MDTSTLLELLVSAGLFTSLAETIRWVLGRNTTKIGNAKVKVDNAKVVEGMALDLLTPLRETLKATTDELAGLRKTCTLLNMQMESVLVWAVAVVSILDTNGVKYPTVPDPIEQRIKGQA